MPAGQGPWGPAPARCTGAGGAAPSPADGRCFLPVRSRVPLGPPAALEGGHGRPARRGQHQARRSRPHHQHLQLYLVFGRQGLASHFPSPSAQWTEHHAHAEKGQVEPSWALALCVFTPREVEGAGICHLWGWQQPWEGWGVSAHPISKFCCCFAAPMCPRGTWSHCCGVSRGSPRAAPVHGNAGASQQPL